MEHKKLKELISSYFDGELDNKERNLAEKHLKECSECRKEFEGMREFEEVMGKVEFKKPSQEVWKLYWTSVYNRLERSLGWILLSVGAMILLFFGGFKAIEGIIKDTTIPIILKIGILALLAGGVVLLVSVIRERIFVRRRERYKEVEK